MSHYDNCSREEALGTVRKRLRRGSLRAADTTPGRFRDRYACKYSGFDPQTANADRCRDATGRWSNWSPPSRPNHVGIEGPRLVGRIYPVDALARSVPQREGQPRKPFARRGRVPLRITTSRSTAGPAITKTASCRSTANTASASAATSPRPNVAKHETGDGQVCAEQCR